MSRVSQTPGTRGARARARALMPIRSLFKSRMEADYAEELALRRHAGEIRHYRFEAVRFRLAENAWYTPDFWVELADGTIEIHEVKGHRKEAGMVRYRVAAESWPSFRWILIERKAGGGWKRTVYGGRGA